jgi:hypothetical protein
LVLQLEGYVRYRGGGGKTLVGLIFIPKGDITPRVFSEKMAVKKFPSFMKRGSSSVFTRLRYCESTHPILLI